MKSAFFAALVAFSGAGLVFGASAVVAAPTGERFPATVELRPEKASFVLGEPIFLKFVVKNPTDSTWKLMVGGDYRNALGRPDSFKVQVRDAQGKSVPQPDSQMNLGGLFGPQKVPARGELGLSLFLPHWATFSTSGRYRVTAKRPLVFLLPGKTISDYFKKEGSLSIPAEASVDLDVLPPDPQKLGAIIQELGEAASKSDAYSNASAQKLRVMRDVRVVPFLIRAASRPNPDISMIYALGTWNNSAAFETLKKLATQRDFQGAAPVSAPGLIAETTDGVRLSAAQAIARSQNDGRTEFLLSLLRDPYYAVRLTVVQSIGGLPPSSARAVWRAMMRDSNADVRSESKRYLNESLAKEPKSAPLN